MDFWIMTAELLLLIAAGVHLRRRKYEFDSLRREYGALERWAKSLKDGSDTWTNRYREAADQAEMNAAERDEFEAKARDFAKKWADAETAKETAELEAERARKECAMHEMERRQLVQKLETLRDEYAKLLSQETDAEMILRTEMANFLSYTGSENGQKELKVHNVD